MDRGPFQLQAQKSWKLPDSVPLVEKLEGNRRVWISSAAMPAPSQGVLNLDLIANRTTKSIFLIHAEFDAMLRAYLLPYRFHRYTMDFAA